LLDPAHDRRKLLRKAPAAGLTGGCGMCAGYGHLPVEKRTATIGEFKIPAGRMDARRRNTPCKGSVSPAPRNCH